MDCGQRMLAEGNILQTGGAETHYKCLNTFPLPFRTLKWAF